MGTTFEILIPGAAARYAAEAAMEAFSELGRIEGELSRFVPTSDIARINILRRGETMKLGPDGFACLRVAAEMSALTGGAFDVTATGPGRRRGRRVRLALDLKTRMVKAADDGVNVDLGGIGKGYALDCMAAVLEEWEVGSALVHGGESTAYATGAPPGKPAWRVKLRHPGRRGPGSAGVALLTEGAVSGSALLVRGRHVFDPRTGRAVPRGRASWAAASSAARADALSTAFLVMSWREVERLCARYRGIAAGLARRSRGGIWDFGEFGVGTGVVLGLRLGHHRRHGA
jgi:thiamine biosynthesis lipoprotein